MTHRETKKPRQAVPEVPDLGRLSMPRRRNRAAARYVAEIGPLWDRRRADRAARKHALRKLDAQAESPRMQHLDKAVREGMLLDMKDWSFDHPLKAFVPNELAEDGFATEDEVEQLLDAISALDPHNKVVLRVSGLGPSQFARARGYLAEGQSLFGPKR